MDKASTDFSSMRRKLKDKENLEHELSPRRKAFFKSQYKSNHKYRIYQNKDICIKSSCKECINKKIKNKQSDNINVMIYQSLIVSKE